MIHLKLTDAQGRILQSALEDAATQRPAMTRLYERLGKEVWEQIRSDYHDEDEDEGEARQNLWFFKEGETLLLTSEEIAAMRDAENEGPEDDDQWMCVNCGTRCGDTDVCPKCGEAK